jgi:hypothetical protein
MSGEDSDNDYNYNYENSDGDEHSGDEDPHKTPYPKEEDSDYDLDHGVGQDNADEISYTEDEIKAIEEIRALGDSDDEDEEKLMTDPFLYEKRIELRSNLNEIDYVVEKNMKRLENLETQIPRPELYILNKQKERTQEMLDLQAKCKRRFKKYDVIADIRSRRNRRKRKGEGESRYPGSQFNDKAWNSLHMLTNIIARLQVRQFN